MSTRIVAAATQGGRSPDGPNRVGTRAVDRLLDAEPARVALLRPRTGLGDVLCTVPALRALRARLPEAHVTWITYAEMAPALHRLPTGLVDDLLAFPGHPLIPERPADPQGWHPFLAAARERRFDLVVQCYGGRPAANRIVEALGARRTSGFFLPGQSHPADLDAWLPWPEADHEVRRHLRLMAHLGAPSRGEALELPLGPEDEREARAVCDSRGLHGPYALLHPGATSPSRRWPTERFAAVGAGLAARGLQLAVTGVGAEREVCLALLAQLPSAVDLCDATGLGAFAALVRDSAVVVTNDTGTGHVAQAVGAASVTVFLSGDPVRFGPLAGGPHRVARRQVECNPCEHLRCPIDHRCATEVAPSEVLALCDGLLGPSDLLASVAA